MTGQELSAQIQAVCSTGGFALAVHEVQHPLALGLVCDEGGTVVVHLAGVDVAGDQLRGGARQSAVPHRQGQLVDEGAVLGIVQIAVIISDVPRMELS